MKDREIHGESNVWNTAQRLKKYLDLMFMLGLNETINQLAMANSVHWHGHVLKREDGHVLRMALDFEVEGQRMKGKSKDEREAKEDIEKAG